MELVWMGKYRNIVEKCIRYGNVYASAYKKEYHVDSDLSFTPAQVQVLEYILENEEKNESMGQIAARLGISQSAFSKNVQKMTEKGLLEKYHFENNRKTVIVKPTEKGRKAYEHYSEYIYRQIFQKMFTELDAIPFEYVERFAHILDMAAGPAPECRDPALIPETKK